MRITLIQSQLQWEHPQDNRQHFESIIQPLAHQTDLILLPEMFTTGFSMNTQPLAETMDGATPLWMLEQARRTGAALCGSFICRTAQGIRNRLLFAKPDGTLAYYDKKHLFTPAGEHLHYTPGTTPCTVHWRNWSIRTLICYDLRFPEWARNHSENPYDLLIVVANWPEKRSHHWSSLLTARAIENQTYVAGLNIVGTDGNQLQYNGHSTVVNYNGHTIGLLQYSEAQMTVHIELPPLQEFRKQLPFLKDQDRTGLLTSS
jgi:predicted amidohydrolase